MSKLCLGTVQFGMEYGINNKLGQPSKSNCFKMLDIAIDNGIKKIDTAAAYGVAEELLGEYVLKRGLKNKIDILSKLTPNVIQADESKTRSLIREQVTASLKKLNLERLDGYLLHTPSYVYREDVLEALSECKEEGLVNHVGVSIYEMEDGFYAIQTGKVDYIQLPYSIFDQRGEHTGLLSKAKENNVTVFARSAFLQGLAMMDVSEVPDHIRNAKVQVEAYDCLAKRHRVDKASGLLHYVYDNKDVDYLVFGVDSEEQLMHDVECVYEKTVSSEFISEARDIFHKMDESIIFPSLWAKS